MTNEMNETISNLYKHKCVGGLFSLWFGAQQIDEQNPFFIQRDFFFKYKRGPPPFS